MKRNVYEKFKNPGVVGKVPTTFESKKIFEKAGESLVVYIGRLDKNAYDYGFEINLKDKTHLRRLPGVGSGWFRLKDHALGFALYAILIGFKNRLTNEAEQAVKNMITFLISPELDLK